MRELPKSWFVGVASYVDLDIRLSFQMSQEFKWLTALVEPIHAIHNCSFTRLDERGGNPAFVKDAYEATIIDCPTASCDREEPHGDIGCRCELDTSPAGDDERNARLIQQAIINVKSNCFLCGAHLGLRPRRFIY